MKMQSTCMTKDRGPAGTVTLACLGSRGGVFPYLVRLLHLQCWCTWHLPHLTKYHLQRLAVWVLFEMLHLQRDTASARGTGIRWGLYHSCPTVGMHRSQTIVGVPLHYLLILHPMLTTKNQNGSVCLDVFAISFRTAWKDSVQFITTELPQIWPKYVPA